MFQSQEALPAPELDVEASGKWAPAFAGATGREDPYS